MSSFDSAHGMRMHNLSGKANRAKQIMIHFAHTVIHFARTYVRLCRFDNACLIISPFVWKNLHEFLASLAVAPLLRLLRIYKLYFSCV